MDALLAPAVRTDHQDFAVPSPHTHLYDISPNPGSSYDFDSFPDSAHFPHTPSYNGSYQNSPYSSYSDLPPIDGNDPDLALFNDDNPSGISITEEYDPTDFDPPSSGGPLLIDDPYINAAHVSVSVTPPLHDYSSPNAFDHASPASSNGLEDDNHSHASSNSSYMHPSSPHDFSQTFQDSLSFRSPAWPVGQLPDDRRSPPLHKPQSPPQLLIPDHSSPGADAPPTINAPDGDGGLIGSGPTLQIVPATPVSGGGVTARNVPFRDTLGTLQQGMLQRAVLACSPSLINVGLQARQLSVDLQMRNGSSTDGTTHRVVSSQIPRRSPTRLLHQQVPRR
ncbi:uncharacterized protein BXZ73DRAFT_38313 [Epithele typhae]|uniref:uncharacterized protein n=1 Tax=Epithele typhae TaxID=378194 RepID=UPI002008D678|nr:uncharacterized protein BXZ73DRAFT_38313 [Epithele typhae]KAH9945121.1 hypothetical protein BXZ73DRAFT_38313 [Epithele typhae]